MHEPETLHAEDQNMQNGGEEGEELASQVHGGKTHTEN
jgi:hypothetical protein